jgi:light-regulated signal transduction histidine kinase (bacteriophytochrome)
MLEVSNKELEGFSYETSHVLRAPLRAVDGFSRILLEDHAGQLDSEGKRLLGIVRSSALDMGEVVEGILGFLRLGRDELSLSTIEMTEIVRNALKELEPKIRGRDLKIELPALPSAFGDPAMIQRVWTQLLDNAIKFSPKDEAKIVVGAVPGKGETVYFVRDNGVGFDMQYTSKLFRVFQRLHGSEIAGNGMGLAVVQRVIARHGGRVWAEGKPNEGATFYFSLPAKENAHA